MDGALTPEMLSDVRFARARHGYRVEDVDDFLARVAKGLAALQADVAALSDKLAELEAELPVARAERVLAAATALADTLVAEATREAEMIASACHGRVVATARSLLAATEGSVQALALVDALRAELGAAGSAMRQLAECSPAEGALRQLAECSPGEGCGEAQASRDAGEEPVQPVASPPALADERR